MQLTFLGLLMFLCLVLPDNVMAVSIAIDSYPQKITERELQVGFTVTGAKKAINYFKVLLFNEGTHKYLVRTWNGHTWYDGGNGNEYFPVDIVGSSASALIKAQIPSSVTNGQYLLSIKRFTASGNPASDSVSPVFVSLDLSIPTTLTPYPTPTPTPSPVITPELPDVLFVPEKIEEVVVANEESDYTPPTALVVAAQKEVLGEKSTDSGSADSPSLAHIFLAIIVGITGLLLTLFGGYHLSVRLKRLV